MNLSDWADLHGEEPLDHHKIKDFNFDEEDEMPDENGLDDVDLALNDADSEILDFVNEIYDSKEEE